MSLLPICKNCKYFRSNRLYLYSYGHQPIVNGRCTHPTSQTMDLVSGVPTYELAKTMRDNMTHTCGENASFYVDASMAQYVSNSILNFDAMMVAYVIVYAFLFVMIALVLRILMCL